MKKIYIELASSSSVTDGMLCTGLKSTLDLLLVYFIWGEFDDFKNIYTIILALLHVYL